MGLKIASYPVSIASFFLHVGKKSARVFFQHAKKKAGSGDWVASFPVLPTPDFVGCETKAGVGRTGNEARDWVRSYLKTHGMTYGKTGHHL